MPAKELLLDQVHAAAARVLEHAPEVAVCYAYGSRVHGRVLPLSDLDLAFLPPPGTLPVAEPARHRECR